MIRIDKPRRPPAILRGKGTAATHELCRQQERGETSFTFDSKIYGAKPVKDALLKAQHDKCAFCESLLTHITFGDVEHFRPKAGWKNSAKDKLTQPGYYWLAYEWSNLYASCQLCNQRFKKNLFPLKVPAKRARSHRDHLDKEEALLIDPGQIDPEDFLAFRQEYVIAIDDNEPGRTTIEVLGLNREALAEQRRQYLDLVESMRDTHRELAEEPGLSADLLKRKGKIEAMLVELQKNTRPYSAMVRKLLT